MQPLAAAYRTYVRCAEACRPARGQLMINQDVTGKGVPFG
jgi:hypothetical protein